jgi:hypothetical protein
VTGWMCRSSPSWPCVARRCLPRTATAPSRNQSPGWREAVVMCARGVQEVVGQMRYSRAEGANEMQSCIADPGSSPRTHTHTHICTPTRTRVHTHAHARALMHARTHASAHARPHARECTRTPACTRVHIHAPSRRSALPRRAPTVYARERGVQRWCARKRCQGGHTPARCTLRSTMLRPTPAR